MNIRFNIEKSQRKALAQKIGELTGSEVKYLGVPSCAYEIGFFTLSKDAVLSFADRMDTEVIERVLPHTSDCGACCRQAYYTQHPPHIFLVSLLLLTLDISAV